MSRIGWAGGPAGMESVVMTTRNHISEENGRKPIGGGARSESGVGPVVSDPRTSHTSSTVPLGNGAIRRIDDESVPPRPRRSIEAWSIEAWSLSADVIGLSDVKAAGGSDTRPPYEPTDNRTDIRTAIDKVYRLVATDRIRRRVGQPARRAEASCRELPQCDRDRMNRRIQCDRTACGDRTTGDDQSVPPGGRMPRELATSRGRHVTTMA